MSDPDGNAAARVLPECASAPRAGGGFAPLSSFSTPALADLLRPFSESEVPIDAIVLPDGQPSHCGGNTEEALEAIVLPDMPLVMRIARVELPTLAVAYNQPGHRGNMVWGAVLACGVALAILLNVAPQARPPQTFGRNRATGQGTAAGQGTGSAHADALGANFTATRCGYATDNNDQQPANRCVLEGTLEALGDEMRTRGQALHDQAIRQSAVRAAATEPLPPVDQEARGSR